MALFGPVRPIAAPEEMWGVGEYASETHTEKMMHHLMMNAPIVGTLGVAALLAGPLARLPIDLGAWLLERWLGGRSA